MKNFLHIIPASLFALGAAGTLCGCATLFCGTSEEVRIDSMPSGASVFLNGKNVGQTPLKVELDRDTHPLIVLSQAGFPDTRIQIDWTVNPVVLTDVFTAPLFLLGFPITGIIYDVRSGAACSYAEDDIVVPQLQPDETELKLYDDNVILTNFKN